MTFALVIALAAVFAIASPLNVAVAQTTSDAIPDGEDEKGEYKDGKSCPFKERKSQQSSEQSSS